MHVFTYETTWTHGDDLEDYEINVLQDLKGNSPELGTEMVSLADAKAAIAAGHKLEWLSNLPEVDGLYVWRDISMVTSDDGPVGGLVAVVTSEVGYGWPCKDGQNRTTRGFAKPSLTYRNNVVWLLLSSKVDNL